MNENLINLVIGGVAGQVFGTVNQITVTERIDGSVKLSTPQPLHSGASFIALNVIARGELRLADSDASNYVVIKSPAVLSANYALTLPANDGAAGQTLSTDGTGILSWKTLGISSSTDNAIVRFDGSAGEVQNSGVIIDDSDNVTVPGNHTTNGSIFLGTILMDDTTYALGTGVRQGGVISINTSDNTKLDITAGSALIVDHSNIASPVVNRLTWAAQTIDPSLNGVRSKWLGVKRDTSGDPVFEFDVSFSALEKRTHAIIGRCWGAGTAPVTGTGQYSTPSFGQVKLAEDLVHALGSLNISGNVFSANGANLLLDKAAGESFRFSAAFGSAPVSPNIHSDAAVTGATSYKYHLQNANSTVTESDIDPNNYDVSGTKTAVPSNKYTLQRIYYFPVSQTIHIIYGQTIYNSLGEATAAAGMDSPNLNTDILSGAILRGWLAVKQGTTELNDTSDAAFISAANIGSAGAVGGATTFISLTDTPISYTAGSVLFTSGSAVTEDNSNLFYDDTNNRLGIGTNSPAADFHIKKSGSVKVKIQANHATSNASIIFPAYNVDNLEAAGIIYDRNAWGTGKLYFAMTTFQNWNDYTLGSNSAVITLDTTNYDRRVGIGTSSPGSILDVKGTLRLSGSTSGYVGLAPAAIAGSTTYTLPTADGDANNSLVTDGSATLKWENASSLVPITTKTAAYTATIKDNVILCNGTFTITLFTAVGNAGRKINIKNIGTGTITIDGNAAETIDGATIQATTIQYDSFTLVSDGANWFII